MKSLFQKNSQNLHVVPELHISRGLDYANRRHNGFSEAFKRIKSWCDFGVNYSGETGKNQFIMFICFLALQKGSSPCLTATKQRPWKPTSTQVYL